jgi:hypothetical protein
MSSAVRSHVGPSHAAEVARNVVRTCRETDGPHEAGETKRQAP